MIKIELLIGVSSWEDSDAGKDWGQKEKRAAENEMVGKHHQLKGHELGQTAGDGEGQKGLECCSPRDCKESDTLGDWTTAGMGKKLGRIKGTFIF